MSGPWATQDPPTYEGVTGSGSDLGRIIALSDGVLSFSMTLLVTDLALPAVSQSGILPSITTYLGQHEPRVLD